MARGPAACELGHIGQCAAMSIMTLCGSVTAHRLPEFEVCEEMLSDVLREVFADVALIRNPAVAESHVLPSGALTALDAAAASTPPLDLDPAAMKRNMVLIGPDLARVTATLNVFCDTHTKRRVFGLALPTALGKTQQQLVEQWHVPVRVRLLRPVVPPERAHNDVQRRAAIALEHERHADEVEQALLVLKQRIVYAACSSVPDWCVSASAQGVMRCTVTYAPTPAEALGAPAGYGTCASEGSAGMRLGTVAQQLLVLSTTPML